MSKFLSSMDEKTQKLVMAFIKIFIVMIAIVVFFVLITSCTGGKVNYNNLENIIDKASHSFFDDNQDRLPTSNGEEVRINISELVAGKYMKELSKYTSDSCTGYTIVTYNGGNYLYNVKLDCTNYKTKTIEEVIEDTVVTDGDGLYLVGNEYYYRGKYVNNYIKLDNNLYRILGIDKNGNLKLIPEKTYADSTPWDTRYNKNQNLGTVGINDYERSLIQENFTRIYNNLSDKTKEYILEYDWCIGKRRKNDKTKDKVECNETLKDFVATILPSEFINASLDKDCLTLYDGSCRNYNYLVDNYTSSIWTLSSVMDNTYENYRINNGSINAAKTINTYRLLPAFYISGNNIYLSGSGTNVDPYIIK